MALDNFNILALRMVTLDEGMRFNFEALSRLGNEQGTHHFKSAIVVVHRPHLDPELSLALLCDRS